LSKGLLAAALLLPLCAGPPASAQGPAAPPQDAEREAVRKAVETYLYAEDVDEKKPVSDAGARIFSADHARGRVNATPLSAPARKPPKGAKAVKTARSPQRIASIEVFDDAASVKVSTDFTPDERGDEANTHYQLIWLLKVAGGWKIVGILMPHVAPRPSDR
jgi:hypothetical protein